MTAPGTSLLGRAALVNGGGRGLGQAMAISLAPAGAAVVVTSRSEQELDKTIAHLPQRVANRVIADIDDPDAGKRPLRGSGVSQRRHRRGAQQRRHNVLYRPFIPLPEFTLEEAGFDEGEL